MTERLRILVAAIGWTGHAFPALALARELHARGSVVAVESFERWRAVVEEMGVRFSASPERMSFPGLSDGGGGPTLAEAALDVEPLLRDLRPHVVVTDLFTLAPALAAERARIRTASLIPHPYPAHEPGLPFYPLGLLPPRTPAGRLAWRLMWPAVGTRLPNTRLRKVRATLNRTRADLGLAPMRDFDGQISDGLAMVATFPQLEYPRRWPPHAHVTGPMKFELPHPEIELPTGPDPLVLVASSTERDPELRLVKVVLEALADEPVRVVATANRPRLRWAHGTPDNARVIDWLPYAQVMPRASLVICHGGHGTIARALGEGAPLLVCPPAGDMAENGARVAWAGAGLMLPNRLLRRGPMRWVVRRLLSSPGFAEGARAIAAWAERNRGEAIGADLVERYARA